MKFRPENILKIAAKFGVEKLQEITKYVAGNQQATTFDEIPEGVGEFGTNKNNPIPTFGILGNEIYLNKLYLISNNKRIKWERKGSVFSETINCPIDEYKVFDCKNIFITYLYISPYHFKNSNKPPNGLYIRPSI